MPFINQNPIPFNKASVEALNQNKMGVYGLYRHGQWIYVGKGDIRQRLLDHLNGDNPCITREKPTHCVAEVIINIDAREKQLIKELDPICNKNIV